MNTNTHSERSFVDYLASERGITVTSVDHYEALESTYLAAYHAWLAEVTS
jgi:hypothetical protein